MSDEPYSTMNDVMGEERVDPDYRAISPLALLGLVLGLASAAAFLHPLLFVLPVAAILACAVALRHASDPSSGVSGRGVALFGLALALVLGGGGVTRYVSHQAVIQRQSREMARQWFASLAEGQPQSAHQLMVEPEKRTAAGAKLWQQYRDDGVLQSALRNFVESPPAKALLWLGRDAQVRNYDIEFQIESSSKDQIREVYAVTFEDQGKKKTFFVRLTLVRSTNHETGITGWRIADVAGPILPEAYALPPAPRGRAR